MGVNIYQCDHLNAKKILSSIINAFGLYEISWFPWQPIYATKRNEGVHTNILISQQQFTIE